MKFIKQIPDIRGSYEDLYDFALELEKIGYDCKNIHNRSAEGIQMNSTNEKELLKGNFLNEVYMCNKFSLSDPGDFDTLKLVRFDLPNDYVLAMELMKCNINLNKVYNYEIY